MYCSTYYKQTKSFIIYQLIEMDRVKALALAFCFFVTFSYPYHHQQHQQQQQQFFLEDA